MKKNVVNVLCFIAIIVTIIYGIVFYISEPILIYTSKDDIDVIYNRSLETYQVYVDNEYTKKGTKYIEFHTNCLSSDRTDEPSFTFSEDEYNKYIGEGNDAFDTERYSCYAKVIIYQDCVFNSVLNRFYQSFHNYSAPYDRHIECKTYGNRAYIYFDKESHTLTCTVSYPTRYSFIEEENFSETDEEDIKNMIDSMAKDVLKMIDGKEPELEWE